jgi:2-amino-4-hydroxy-6-hydroxymethyldihydropteridine diphosphokinase
MNRSYLSLGSNQGDRLKYLEKAIILLEEGGGHVTARSAVYETEPWGFASDISFYNQAVELISNQGPWQLLDDIHKIENSCGRTRGAERYVPRTLDIDILLFNSDIINTPELVLPHPGLHLRRFVLVPLAEIASLIIHPVLLKSISELLQFCNDDKRVIRRLS